MPNPINFSPLTIYEVPSVTVYTADILAEDSFEKIDYLYLDRLRVCAAPEVDTCQLSYEYGDIKRNDSNTFEVYSPLDIVGKYVKVEIGPTLENDDPITWYGRIRYASSSIDGSGVDGSTPTGTQEIIAYGLLSLLDERIVEESTIDNGGGDTITIKKALPFNHDPGGYYAARGNRGSKIDGAYTFSQSPRTGDTWKAGQAVDYLLKYHSPRDDAGTDANRWWLSNSRIQRQMLDWYDISIDTELKTTKQILDQLISRHRGVGYFVEFQPSDDSVLIQVFSFASDDVRLPSGNVLPANQNQRTIDLDESKETIDASLSDVSTSTVHRVRAFGEYMTSTFTAQLSPSSGVFEKAWTSSDEAGFKSGASGDSLYASQTTDTKSVWNAIARTNDKYSAVYSRWKFYDGWGGVVNPPHYGLYSEKVWPKIPEDGSAVDDTHAGGDLWIRGTRVLHYLPFKDGVDYSGTIIADDTFNQYVDGAKYIPIMAYVRVIGTGVDVTSGTPPRFALVEKLNHTMFATGTNQRLFACSVNVPDTMSGVEIKAHPQQMIAKADWSGAEHTDTTQDPTTADGNGLDWRDIFVTLAIEIPKRVQYTAEITTPTAGEPISEISIYVPRARCDYVVPQTTVRIDNGIPIVNTSGGFIQDDRIKVADIARAAAEWYGKHRKTIQIGIDFARHMGRIGYLITDLGDSYASVGINTPITAYEYMFPKNIGNPPKMKIETSFAEMDFV